MFLSLLRAPAYAAHPIEERKLVHEERFIPRMDQGEHHLRFAVCGGNAEARRKRVDFEAQIMNEELFMIPAFPSGDGVQPKPMLLLSELSVQLTALYYDAQKDGYVARLWNTQGVPVKATVSLPVWDTKCEIELGAYQFCTYCIDKKGNMEPTSIF